MVLRFARTCRAPLAFAVLLTSFTLWAADPIDLGYRVNSVMGTLRSGPSDHALGNFTVGMKSQNMFGAVSKFAETLRSKNEVFGGLRTDSGWGFLVGFGYTSSYDYGAPSDGSKPVDDGADGLSARKSGGSHKDAAAPPPSTTSSASSILPPRSGNSSNLLDPSMTLVHPVFRNETVSISGTLRTTIPVSPLSVALDSRSYSYNSLSNIQLKEGLSLSNVLGFTYFQRDLYPAPFNSKYSLSLTTSLNHHYNSWCRLGVGQRSAEDFHQGAPPGQAVEAFVLADFMWNTEVFMGPRIHFPLASFGSTYSEVPTTPKVENISAEFFLQAAL